MERTLIMVKPDGVQRGLVGEIVNRFERKGLKLTALKMMWLDTDFAHKHYASHEGRYYYPRLVKYITSGPVVAMVWSGIDAIAVARKLIGSTDPLKAESGTIRGDFGTGVSMNLVHASDCEEAARSEISLFFREDELFSYAKCIEPWLGQPDN